MKTPFTTSLRGLILAISATCLVSALHAENVKESKETKTPAHVLKKYDANNDGILDSTEKAKMKADQEAKKAELLAKYDANKNGKLDEEEKAQMKADREAAKPKKKAPQAPAPVKSEVETDE